MHEERLCELLQELPEERASLGFNGRVMQRIAARRRESVRNRLAAAAVLTVMLASAATFGLVQQRRVETQRAQIDAEHRELRRELEALKQATPQVDATIAIGSTDEAEYVIDVGEMSRSTGSGVVYTSNVSTNEY